MNKITVEEFRRQLSPSASHGYAQVFVCTDSAVLCYKCACENESLIVEAIEEQNDEQWEVIAVGGHSEGDAMPCSHCHEFIESDYGAVSQFKK